MINDRLLMGRTTRELPRSLIRVLFACDLLARASREFLLLPVHPIGSAVAPRYRRLSEARFGPFSGVSASPGCPRLVDCSALRSKDPRKHPRVHLEPVLDVPV
jgi:hypothetical protein